MNDSSLVKQVYIELSLLHLCGFDTWYGRARELVQKYSLEPNANSQKLKKKHLNYWYVMIWKETGMKSFRVRVKILSAEYIQYSNLYFEWNHIWNMSLITDLGVL